MSKIDRAMHIVGRRADASRTKVAIVTGDAAFERIARETFGASNAIELIHLAGRVTEESNASAAEDATVLVIDIDPHSTEELTALAKLMARIGTRPPVIAVLPDFDATVARALMQMRVADFLVKPVAPVDLVRACAQVAKGPAAVGEPTEAQIYTFLPAAGGVGVTTLAIQTAILLMRGAPRERSSTCLVDLDFQHGAVADYLDLEPRLNLAEIEPRPDRLDRQLLEVMLSYHASGLAVVAAPNRPAEMRSFDPDVVTRLLDLVSSHFDYVVFDMPRTWFSWTDSVLLGSDRLYIVSETTVPGLRHAKQLVSAIKERLGDGPNPQVIVNRFQQSMFSAGLRLHDLQQTLGEAFAFVVPNDYPLVREAIDRGVPLDEIKAGNKITAQLKKLIVDRPVRAAEGGSLALAGRLKQKLAKSA